MKQTYILTYACIVIAFLFYFEQFANASFLLKTCTKLILLLLIPLYLIKNTQPMHKVFTIPQKKTLLAIALAIATIITVYGVYLGLAQFISLENITQLLREIGVTAANFWLVAIYITFGNSLAEEIFFRGMLAKKPILSSLLFAIYHIGFTLSWFTWYIFSIVFIGLFVGGLVFHWLNNKSGSIINGWIMHIGADIAIVIIGLQMFYF